MSLEKFTQKGGGKSAPLQKTNADGDLALKKRGRPRKEGLVSLIISIPELAKKKFRNYSDKEGLALSGLLAIGSKIIINELINSKIPSIKMSGSLQK